jgi:type IV secretory pathway TrbL component
VGIILILVKYFSFFAFRVLYRIISYPYHIIYLASISSYIFLFLSLKKGSVSYVRRSFIYVSLNRF